MSDNDQGNNAMDKQQATAMIELLHKIDNELTEFKGKMQTELTDTNGRMKGNHELTEQKIIHLEEVNKLQFENIKNEQRHLQERIDRAFIQSEEHYTEARLIKEKLPEIKDEIKEELGNKSQFNITTILSGIAIVGMIVFGIMAIFL